MLAATRARLAPKPTAERLREKNVSLLALPSSCEPTDLTVGRTFHFANIFSARSEGRHRRPPLGSLFSQCQFRSCRYRASESAFEFSRMRPGRRRRLSRRRGYTSSACPHRELFHTV